MCYEVIIDIVRHYPLVIHDHYFVCIQASFSGSSTFDHDGGYANPEVKAIDHMPQIDWRPGT